MVVASILSGALINRVGYYTPFMYVGVCMMSVGAGLLYTLEIDTPTAKWVGYQLLYGWGMGTSAQVPNIAAQTVLDKKDIPAGTALLFFAQLLGGTIFVSVGQNVLEGQLLKRFSQIPGLSPEMIENNGATSLVNLPEPIKTTALIAYNESLRHVFLVGLILVCLTSLGAVGIEWRTVKKNLKKSGEKKEEEGTVEAKSDDETGRGEASIAEKSVKKDDDPASRTTVNKGQKK
ncbi:putative mfs aflatoxin efflux protein [Phaeoacremonium minimum UCRPA7]|uniref:Putative mfs aflatoxin efflux protein n=1 Tax=Phaeoacremonium minimum (strain UCR-PA7) TaxID=1286976 RepID=R8BP15_PHAM7|nr:putative mfs aflatoxin efflux protein [Phaeoacremonium minimum UCRPA7]EOO01077.1 putative mfs aflatoxin efflux protein [Phaeoacremonium minimum UCRPA7]